MGRVYWIVRNLFCFDPHNYSFNLLSCMLIGVIRSLSSPGMKMDMALNSQEVGQLFVMQYYTQMHSDASQMHRFYLNDSSFVFGGPEIGTEQPVIGQKVS